MPTTKKRINITANKDIEEALTASAKRSGMSISKKITELLRDALELEEDLAWAAIVDERLSKKNIKWVSHKNAWKRIRNLGTL